MSSDSSNISGLISSSSTSNDNDNDTTTTTTAPVINEESDLQLVDYNKISPLNHIHDIFLLNGI